ncbi:fungal-specific transcription factor domain-containing protein [Lentinula raphanica]|uniref:Fungal-specific transcription factor domain-containing protein n=1 Tax=Lentinula raphanica TaxID=153919 RepID=A0AA38UJ18_9AGAR|nr:fungal-specific transcription factor domain-containing protein [Lentinula raphanica]KAJ3842746.1 fungal-specific transcription factor domain-containing protein [Lentinula raphanica]
MSDGEDLVSHKKRRLQNACDQCRSRKIKCDSANMPNNICSSCIAFKADCTHVAATTKKKRGPPKGTPRGQRTLKSIVNSILSKSYQLPTDPAAINKLLFDLAEHIHFLDEEIQLLHEHFDGLNEPSSTFSVMVPSNQSSNNQPSTTDDLLVYQSQVSKAPPGSYLDSDVHAIESLDDHFQRLTFADAKDRHFGGSSSLMLVKTAIDIKNEYENPSATSSQWLEGVSDCAVPEPDFKRREFWTIHPWQIIPEHYTPPFIFPDDDLIDSLVHLYFTHVNAYFPIIHEPSFKRSINQDLHHRDKHFGALVLAVCALGARYSDDERIFEDNIDGSHDAKEQSIGWKWVRQIQPVRRTFIAPPSIYEIQLYQIYVFFMQSTSTPEICWILVSIGVRFVQDIGAHRKKLRDTKPTLESELWKRAFWIMYMMDIFTSSFLGRPRSIGVEDFDIDLPIDCDDEYWENADHPEQAFQQPPQIPSRISYLICFIKLMDILGLAMRTIYSIRRSDKWTATGMNALQWNEKNVTELDSSLNKWIDDLPDHLRWDPTRENTEHFHQSVMLHSTYYWVQIQIHRPFIARPGEGSVLRFPSLAICANAARTCCHIMEVQRRRNPNLLSMPNLLMALFNSSLVLLVNAWRGQRLKGSGSDIEKGLSDVHRCIDLLSLHENRWQAGRYCDILREIIAISHFHHEQRLDYQTSGMKRSHEAALGGGEDRDDSEQTKNQMASSERLISGHPNLINNGASATNFGFEHAENATTRSSHSTEPGGNNLFENLSMLPTHSSELGSLPVYESFTDWSMDNQWLYNTTMASSLHTSNQASTWSNDNGHHPQLHSSTPNVLQAASAPVTFSSASLFEIGNLQDLSAPILGPSTGDFAMSTDGTPIRVDAPESEDTNTNNFTTPDWDDWGKYMASVDEVLQSMNPRV